MPNFAKNSLNTFDWTKLESVSQEGESYREEAEDEESPLAISLPPSSPDIIPPSSPVAGRATQSQLPNITAPSGQRGRGIFHRRRILGSRFTQPGQIGLGVGRKETPEPPNTNADGLGSCSPSPKVQEQPRQVPGGHRGPKQ